MSVISNITQGFFNLTYESKTVIPADKIQLEPVDGHRAPRILDNPHEPKNQMEQLSRKIISYLEFHRSSNVTLIFYSEQADNIRRVLELLYSYQARIQVMRKGKGINISASLVERDDYDLSVQIQKNSLESESDPASTELNDSIFIGCKESYNALVSFANRKNTIRKYQMLPSAHSFQVYEYRSSDVIF
ncbi:MAG: hypothetical protein JSS10_09705 [Verrucomicrobia bacterium]|nr:hypothetical protein [Verrucomicrobiota bacterium]